MPTFHTFSWSETDRSTAQACYSALEESLKAEIDQLSLAKHLPSGRIELAIVLQQDGADPAPDPTHERLKKLIGECSDAPFQDDGMRPAEYDVLNGYVSQGAWGPDHHRWWHWW